MRKIFLSKNLSFGDRKFIPFSDWCFEDKEIIKLIKKKKKIEIFTKLNTNEKKRYYNSIKKYLEIIYPKIYKILNKHHQTNLNAKYWKIVLYPWLNLYLPFLYLKWKLVNKKKVNKNDVFTTFNFNDEDFVINDLGNFKFDEDETLFYTTKALENINSKIKKIKAKKINRNDENKTNFVIDILWKIFFYLTKFLYKNQKLFFVNSSINRKEILKIYLKKFQFPFFYRKLFYKKNALDINLRKKMFNDVYKGKDNFLRFFFQNLYLFTPKSYIEDFESIRKLIYRYYPIGKKFKFFTAFNYKKDDLFKYWVAENSLKDSKYFILQHGGGFGIDDIINEEDYVKEISDKFLTWGWSDHKKSQKFFNLKLSQKNVKKRLFAIKKKGKKKILITFHYFDKTLHRISSQPNNNYERLKKIYSIIQLCNNLENEFDITLRYRSHVDQYWDSSFNKLLFSKNIKFDYGTAPFEKNIHLYDLIIFDANSTTFLESCYHNIPSILLIDKSVQKSRKSFEIFKKNFVKNNIIFFDNKKMLRFLKKKQNFHKWWNTGHVQILIQEFCKNYINTTKNSYPVIKKFL